MRLRMLTPLLVIPILLPAGSGAAPPESIHREILLLEQSRRVDLPRLQEWMTHDDPEVRSRALRAAGRLQDPVLVGPMTASLADPESAVRIEAIFALGQTPAERVPHVLWNALQTETDPEVRGRILEGIGKQGDAASVSRLAGIVMNGTPREARAAALALGVIARRGHDIAEAQNALDRALAGRDPELQWRAAFAVMRGRLAAFNGIRHGLESKDPRTLIYAARAVGALERRRLGERLLPLLDHDDWRVRVEAIRAMARTRQRLHASLVALLIEDPNPNVRLTAIEEIGKLGGAARVIHLDETGDWREYGAYLKSLAHAGEGSLPKLREASQHPDWRVRRSVAEALQAFRTEHPLLLLERMKNDESIPVQTTVVSALAGYPQIHAVELIRGFLGSGDPAVLTSAASAAGQRFDLSAVPGLVAAYDRLQSPVDTETMVAILDALGSILSATEENDPVGTLDDGDRRRAEALLESARHDPDSNVAAAAADALSLVRGDLVSPATSPVAEVPPTFDLDLVLALERGNARPVARIVTGLGTIVVRLFPAEAPGTVANFITLAREGYYNGLTFHRVVADFVIQGGDPRGDGWGGPGYAIRCEINPLGYDRGRMGMALSGKDTGGSQFFITHSPQPHLDGNYTVFGEVVEGMAIVDRIQIGDVIQEITLEGI